MTTSARKTGTTVLCMTLAALTLSACGPSYKMTAPEGFSRFEDAGDFKMISADGVRLKAREVDNYPKATLAFWTDATERHLVARGYASKGKRCFKTAKGLGGCSLDFVIPRGHDDWVLSVTLFVDDDRLIILEVAGPYARYAMLEKKIAAALTTFVP